MNWVGLPERIESKIIPEPNSGCWLWFGATSSAGYGNVWYQKEYWHIHRLVYMLLVCQIPSGLDIDHLCRNRCCCNPDHLEITTRKENLRRGMGISGNNARKTHCHKGHPFSGTNLHDRKDGKGRVCKLCAKLYAREWRRRKS